LPLTASGGGDHGADLLGAGDHSTQTMSDPIAAKVLSRGETLAAPAGRADDFSWPRPAGVFPYNVQITAMLLSVFKLPVTLGDAIINQAIDRRITHGDQLFKRLVHRHLD
jgi:hypothetical protein